MRYLSCLLYFSYLFGVVAVLLAFVLRAFSELEFFVHLSPEASLNLKQNLM